MSQSLGRKLDSNLGHLPLSLRRGWSWCCWRWPRSCWRWSRSRRRWSRSCWRFCWMFWKKSQRRSLERRNRSGFWLASVNSIRKVFKQTEGLFNHRLAGNLIVFNVIKVLITQLIHFCSSKIPLKSRARSDCCLQPRPECSLEVLLPDGCRSRGWGCSPRRLRPPSGCLHSRGL